MGKTRNERRKAAKVRRAIKASRLIHRDLAIEADVRRAIVRKNMEHKPLERAVLMDQYGNPTVVVSERAYKPGTLASAPSRNHYAFVARNGKSLDYLPRGTVAHGFNKG